MWATWMWAAMLAVSWALGIARVWYLRSTAVDHAINAHYALLTIGCTLLSPFAADFIPRVWAVNVALICLVTGLRLSGVVSAYASDRPALWRTMMASPLFASIGIVPVLMTALGYPAGSRGHTPFDQPGPAMLGYWLIYVILIWLYVPALLRVTFLESRADYYGLVGLAAMLVAALLMSGALLGNAALLAVGDRTGFAAGVFAAYRAYVFFLTAGVAVWYTFPMQRRVWRSESVWTAGRDTGGD